MCSLRTKALAAACLALAIKSGGGMLPSGTLATVFYSNNFQQGNTLPEWTSNQSYASNDNFTRFLGRFLNETVALTVPMPQRGQDPNGAYTESLLLEFRLYVIDSWDGSEPTEGIDRFGLRINDHTIFNETFANQHHNQSYDHEPDVGRSQLGFNANYNDSIYNMRVPFDASGESLRVDFFAYGLRGGFTDESWGIDNVRLSTVSPSPRPLPVRAACSAWPDSRPRAVAAELDSCNRNAECRYRHQLINLGTANRILPVASRWMARVSMNPRATALSPLGTPTVPVGL